MLFSDCFRRVEGCSPTFVSVSHRPDFSLSRSLLGGGTSTFAILNKVGLDPQNKPNKQFSNSLLLLRAQKLLNYPSFTAYITFDTLIPAVLIQFSGQHQETTKDDDDDDDLIYGCFRK